jgi:hypothetical protein
MPGIVFQGSRQQINKVVGNREGMSHGAVAQKALARCEENTHIRYQLYYSNLRLPEIQSIKPSGANGFVGTSPTYILLLACAE